MNQFLKDRDEEIDHCGCRQDAVNHIVLFGCVRMIGVRNGLVGIDSSTTALEPIRIGLRSAARRSDAWQVAMKS
jgi:hypothetical protein